jgi:hypothetical protein
MATRDSQRKPTENTVPAAPVVTDATAQALLGMSPRQFRTAVLRQHIPHMKLGRRIVVFFADLQVLAHQNASVSDAHPEPRDRNSRRLAAATEVDDFNASIEHLDDRDRVNAILGRIGRQLTPEAYRDFYKNRKP